MIADLASLVVRRPHEERQHAGWPSSGLTMHPKESSAVGGSVHFPRDRHRSWRGKSRGVGEGPKTNSWSGKAWWRIGMSSSKSLEWADPGYRSTAKPCEQTLLRQGRAETQQSRALGDRRRSDQGQALLDHRQFHGAGRLRGAPQPASTSPQQPPITKSTHPRNKQKEHCPEKEFKWMRGRADLTNPGTRRHCHIQKLHAQRFHKKVP